MYSKGMFSVLLFLFPLTLHAGDYSTLLRNKRLIMKGCMHCGIKFEGKETLRGYAEMAGEIPVTEERIRWISKDLFLTTQKGRNAEGCPPRN